MKPGTRVITPDGPGRIISTYNRCGRIRYGVKLDNWHIYVLQNGLTYYYAEELRPE